ncbi:trithorax group protein osa [Drosophila eugracilis]|uniref:trithorax group protein osa n=1 Tax=Drosophila eugracilis TaxID=29029 RepID=UPI0007E7F22F|nr:trithorax group protein osa [Drosophila eugracilis]
MSNGQQQHPLLLAIPENNYAQTQRMHYYPNHYYPGNYFLNHHHQGHQGGHQGQLGRPPLLAAAGSSHNGAYAASADGSGHSGYGNIEPSLEYELQQEPPSGSFSSYHPSSAGSGPAYPPHSHPQAGPPPPPHPPPSTKATKKSKKSAGSVMNALTLLSFFFFINMLQNCLKDHMKDMNPTVMVLTATGTRNRNNKLSEMNSREQTSTTATESASSWNQPALVPAAVPSVPPTIVMPTVVLQSPYSVGHEVANKPHQHHHSNPQQKPHDYQRPHDDNDNDDDNYGQRRPPPPPSPQTFSHDFYPNRTHIDDYHSQSRPNFESGSDYYQHHYNPYAGTNSRRHPWSYGRQRYSSAPWSSASLGAQSGVSSYLDNAQRRQGDDDDGHGYGSRNGGGYRDRDRNRDRDDDDWGGGDEDEDGQQRRRGDAFYTRTRIN